MSNFNYGIAINAVTHPSVYRATRAMSNLGDSIHKVHGRSTVLAGRQTTFERFGRGLTGVFNGANRAAGGLLSTLFSVQSLLLGTTVGYGLGAISSSFSKTALEMETVYSRLLTSFGGSQGRVLETLDWAKRKAVETPFDLMEVNQMVERMAATGILGKTKDEREKNFTSIGDFAAAKRINPLEAANMAAKSGMGNWEQMADNTGLRPSTMLANAMNAPAAVRTELMALAQIVNSTKAGTMAYKQAVIDFMGLWGKNGMENQMKTITGKLSNIRDMWENFKISLVGITQVEGTLSNRVMLGVGGFLDEFNKIQKTIITDKDGVTRTVLGQLTAEQAAHEIKMGNMVKEHTLMTKLFELGSLMGNSLITVWESIAGSMESSTQTLIRHIEKWHLWFSDFKNNVAPIILILAIYKIRLEKMWDGFKKGLAWLKPWIAVWKGMLSVLGDVLEVLGMIVAKVNNVLKAFGEMTGWWKMDPMDKWQGMGAVLGIIVALTIAWNTGLGKVIKSLVTAVGLGRVLGQQARMQPFAGKRWTKTAPDTTWRSGGNRPSGRPSGGPVGGMGGPIGGGGTPTVVGTGPNGGFNRQQRRNSANQTRANRRASRAFNGAGRPRINGVGGFGAMLAMGMLSGFIADGFASAAQKNIDEKGLSKLEQLLDKLAAKNGNQPPTPEEIASMDARVESARKEERAKMGFLAGVHADMKAGVTKMKNNQLMFDVAKFIGPFINPGSLADGNLGLSGTPQEYAGLQMNQLISEQEKRDAKFREGLKLDLVQYSERSSDKLANKIAGAVAQSDATSTGTSIHIANLHVVAQGDKLRMEQVMAEVHKYILQSKTRSGKMMEGWDDVYKEGGLGF